MAMGFQFRVTAGPNQGCTYLLFPGRERMLGRSAKAEYRLTDPHVSRNHCQVVLVGDEVSIIDNDSQGGTFVNGTRVTQQTLKPGDLLQIGDTQLRLEVGDFSLDVVQGLAKLAADPRNANPAVPQTSEQLKALSGQTLSHYDIGPVIGEGSSSIIFHATDTKDNRPVALKVLRLEFSQNEIEVQRFIRGMKTALPLRHPNLVTVYGAGKTGPYCWVAMEYIAGENLRQVIDRLGVAGRLDWRHAFQVAMQIGKALEYAHGQQIIHRNLTPRNILLEAPTKAAKLGDLMLAKALEGSLAQQITRPGELIGEVAYMAPERTQAEGKVDARSDLYGLGATVYALLAGRPPFEGDSLVETITKIRQIEPVPPTKYQMSIPSHFQDVVMKLLAKRPLDRYQTAPDLLKELRRVGKNQGLSV
jgi:serine/threonine protein kinase